jgi:hypothetical protein
MKRRGLRKIFRIRSSAFPKERQSAGLAEIVQERFCRLEVSGVESFGEPIVDRLQQRHPISRSALIAEQLRKVRGGAQFPGEGHPASAPDRALAARDPRPPLQRRARLATSAIRP